jgi:hypothetical protein
MIDALEAFLAETTRVFRERLRLRWLDHTSSETEANWYFGVVRAHSTSYKSVPVAEVAILRDFERCLAYRPFSSVLDSEQLVKGRS